MMRPRRALPLVAVLLASAMIAAPSAAAAEAETPDEADDAERERTDGPTEGGVPAPFPPPQAPAGGQSWPALMLVGLVAVAAVAGMVVASSVARIQPYPKDPLVTFPSSVRNGSTARPLARRARGTPFEAGLDFARKSAPTSVTRAIELMRSVGLGDARVVARSAGETIVEVRACRSCEARARDGRRRRRLWRLREPDAGCPFERGFLQGAFESALGGHVAVMEIACGRRRRDTCAFAVHEGPKGLREDPPDAREREA